MFLMPPLIKARRIALSFVASAADNSNLTTYTFAGLSLGTPAADRTIIVMLVSDQGNDFNSETVTVAGQSATLITRADGSNLSGGFRLALYRVNLPTGSTGDVVVTLPFQAGSCGVRIYRLVGADSAVPVYSNGVWNGLSTQSFTTNVPANSVSLMGAALENTAASHSWSGSGFPSPTTGTGTAGLTRWSHARDSYETAGTSLNFTVNDTGPTNKSNRAVIAIWK